MTFPLDALRTAAGEATNTGLARRLGVTYRSVLRYQAGGLSPWKADELALRCGLHPGEVWPAWFEAGDESGAA